VNRPTPRGLVKRAQRGEHLVDGDWPIQFRRLAKRWMVGYRGAVRSPRGQNRPLYLGLELGVAGNFEGMKKSGDWLRHG
jgi:hypothetical protein